jgi:predicted metal-dependent phosphoesterase TrpH
VIVCPKGRTTIVPLSVDFHVPTNASKDSRTSPEKTIMTARRGGLNRIVITDHNPLTGASAAHVPDPVLVVIGEEIKTTHGEILELYVSKVVPSGLSPEEIIKRLWEQDAFFSISHPFDSWRSGSWKSEYLLEIIS